MEFLKEPGRIYHVNSQGQVDAEVTFPLGSQGAANINHTFVDESLRGGGVAGQLLAEAAKELRAQGLKARPTCSYAARWFEKHPEEKDLLAE